MSIVAFRRQNNIRRTVQARIGTSLTVSTQDGAGAPVVYTVPVYHDSTFSDPDTARTPSVVPVPRWVTTTWLGKTGAAQGYSMLQCDVYTRIGAQGDVDGDQFGIVSDDIADALLEPFAGCDPSGTLRAQFPCLDWTNVNAPVDAGCCIFCQAPGTPAGWGAPVERRGLGNEGGFRRQVLRFAFRLAVDAVAGFNYRETM